MTEKSCTILLQALVVAGRACEAPLFGASDRPLGAGPSFEHSIAETQEKTEGYLRVMPFINIPQLAD